MARQLRIGYNVANNSYTSYHPDSYKGGANSVTVFAKNKTAAAKAATPNAGSSLGKGTLTSVNGKSVKNAEAIKKAIAQTGETNKIQKNSVRVVGTKQQMETAIKIERSKNINTDGAARARAMEAKLKASSNVKVINTNPVPTRTSGLSGVSGKLGGQHAGGHGASLGGMSGMDLGGGGSFSRENM